MKLILFAVTIQIIIASPSAHAGKNILCRGEVLVRMKSESYPASVTIPMPPFVEGERLSLYQALTTDIEEGAELQIQKVFKTANGLWVIAAYDEAYPGGIMSFQVQTDATGNTRLYDFKGFEGPYPFGPAEIICKTE